MTTELAPRRRRRAGGRPREEGDDYRTISVKLPARLQALVLPVQAFQVRSGGTAAGRRYKKDRLNGLTAAGVAYTGEFDQQLVKALLAQPRAKTVTCWQMPGPMARTVVPEEDIPITPHIVEQLVRGLAHELGWQRLTELLTDLHAAPPVTAGPESLFALEPQMTGT